MKRALILISLLFAVLLCLGCSSNSAQKKGIIALTPSLADAVWALNVEEQYPIVGISPFADDPRAEKIKKISNAGAVETIVSMHPEIVLLHPSDEGLAQKLSLMHIDVMMHGMETFEDIQMTLRDLGKMLKKPDNAELAVQNMRRVLEENASKYAVAQPPEILLIIDRLDMHFQQLYLANSETYLAELVRGCGMKPISAGEVLWTRIEAEKLIELNPENILFFARSAEDADVVEMIFKKKYSTLKAVQTDHMVVYDDPRITVPGPGVVDRQQNLCDKLNRIKLNSSN